MERQEDGQVHHRVAWLVSLVDQWCRPVWPGARWAGLPKAEPERWRRARRRAAAPLDQRGDRLRRGTKRRSPALDKLTGKPMFQVRVIDLDPELSGRSREVVVKVIADRMPVPPTRAPFEPVEFENLTVTPYVIDRTKRMGYSLRATGIKAGRPMPQAGKDAA